MSRWFCVNCGRSFHHQGIAMHRRTHRDKCEKVVLQAGRYEYTYDYTGKAPEDQKEES